ncbi:MAG: sugar ABC transporter permease, partial [Proteobacteria bacterium]|nr:sugar ABC transporter permease [Pseudomonadota bacterium]
MSAIVKHRKTAQRRSKRADLWHRIKKNWAAYVFISPFYILFAVFDLFGLLFSFYISFFRWDGLSPMRWMELQNYAALFADEKFILSIKNTLFLMVFDLPIKLFTPLLLAVALNSKRLKARGAFRTLFYLPEVTPGIVVATMFSYFFRSDRSIVNYVIQLMGGSSIPWFTDPFWAKMIRVLLSGWGSQGYMMIVSLAGLQSIPEELIEAAIVDGANRVQIFFMVTLPLLRPVILFATIITINHALQRFS